MVKIGAQAMLVLHQDEFPNSIGHVLIKPPLSDYQSFKPTGNWFGHWFKQTVHQLPNQAKSIKGGKHPELSNYSADFGSL